MNSIFTHYSHRSSRHRCITLPRHYYYHSLPSFIRCSHSRLFALPASFALSIRSRCNVRFDVPLARISARLEYLIVSNIRSSAYDAATGSKATICPRNGNRNPAEPGNEIRVVPSTHWGPQVPPSRRRGAKIDLNVRREVGCSSTLGSLASVPESGERL